MHPGGPAEVYGAINDLRGFPMHPLIVSQQRLRGQLWFSLSICKDHQKLFAGAWRCPGLAPSSCCLHCTAGRGPTKCHSRSHYRCPHADGTCLPETQKRENRPPPPATINIQGPIHLRTLWGDHGVFQGRPTK